MDFKETPGVTKTVENQQKKKKFRYERKIYQRVGY